MGPEVFGQKVILAIFKIGCITGVAIVFSGFIVGANCFQKTMSEAGRIKHPVEIGAPDPAIWRCSPIKTVGGSSILRQNPYHWQ